MANGTDRNGGETQVDELLFALSVDESPAVGEKERRAPVGGELGAGAKNDPGSAGDPQPTPSALEARLRRIESHLESLIETHREPPAGTARPGGDGVGTAATPQVSESRVEELNLESPSLAGLSERVEPERRLSEKVKPIEEAAGEVRETVQELTAPGRRLDTSTCGTAPSLWVTGTSGLRSGRCIAMRSGGRWRCSTWPGASSSPPSGLISPTGTDCRRGVRAVATARPWPTRRKA